MKLSPRQRKWTKILLILLAIRFIIGGILYYVIAYKFRDIAQYVVNRESKGLYAFDVADVDVSLWKRSIALKNCTLVCNDTVHTSTHYSAAIPEIYFSLQSISDLVFHKKLSIDSMAVISPQLSAHSHNKDEKQTTQVSFQASQIMSNLQKMVEYMQIRALNFKDISFAYSTLKTSVPFKADHINFYIKNFSKKDKSKSYLFSSDDIDLAITNQHWQLPDGIHEVSFKKFHFSGKSQYFELDSCNISVKPTLNHSGISIATDRLFFNSRQLQDLYEKDELTIDTLICFRPVLNVETSSKTSSDSSTAVSVAFQRLFKKISFKYIAIKEGQLLQNGIGNTNATYGTRKADVQLYNVAVNTSKKNGITTDSVKLKLNDIVFVTRDSLFQMAIGEFALDNNDLVLLNATYGPTALNHNDKGMNFTTPVLHLKDISISDLIAGRLRGSNADLVKPVFLVTDKSKTRVEKKAAAKDINHFYKSLHDLHELIAVDSFNIIDGNLHYEQSRTNVKADIRNLDVTILLHRFLRSDSLIDIKRSMPKLTIGEIDAHSPKLDMVVSGYKFQGYNRHNWASQFSLKLAGRNNISGKDLYWEIMDWDMLANHKIINIQYLRAGELSIENGNTASTEKEKHGMKKLPVIVIARADVGHMSFNKKTANGGSIHFTGNDICADDVQSRENYFVWGNMMGALKDLHFSNATMKAQVAAVSFDNAYQTVIKNTSLEMKKDRNKMNFTVPSLTIKSDIHASRINELNLSSVIVDNPVAVINVNAVEPHQEKESRFAIPLNATLKNFRVNNASLRYTTTKANDTMNAKATLSLDIADLVASKSTEKLTYDKATLGLADIQVNKGTMTAALASATLTLANGSVSNNNDKRIALESDLLFKWAGAKMNNNKGDSSILVLDRVAGYHEDTAFVWQPGMKFHLPALLAKTTITEGSAYYKNKKNILTAATINWNVIEKRLAIRDFKLTPIISREEAFKPGNWQADYLTLSGKEVTLDEIHLKKDPDDSAVSIRKITFNEVSLATARDKRLPFRHGVEKPMPTKLINSIRMPMNIDTIQVVNSHVEVHEISKITDREGVIPLDNINALVTNVSNRDNADDSLTVDASAVIFSSYIRKLHYKESYGDSLSQFNIYVNVSPIHLPNLSKSVVPLAAVNVDRGRSDTLFASWTGNKYAAMGDMNFYYDDLKIRLLNPKDSAHGGLKLRIENMLANNLILRTKNTTNSKAFFVRDREKFVFNYWVKTTLGGLLTSAGLKSNKKYIREYEKIRVKYYLPPSP